MVAQPTQYRGRALRRLAAHNQPVASNHKDRSNPASEKTTTKNTSSDTPTSKREGLKLNSVAILRFICSTP